MGCKTRDSQTVTSAFERFWSNVNGLKKSTVMIKKNLYAC